MERGLGERVNQRIKDAKVQTVCTRVACFGVDAGMRSSL